VTWAQNEAGQIAEKATREWALETIAKRHGLRVKAIDVQLSRWPCMIEEEADGSLSMRMGLGYAKGLRKESAEAIVAARERDGRFRSTEDLALRVPFLNRKELTILARVGALNSIDGVAHRRDALWQVERAGKLEGPLFRQRSEWLQEEATNALHEDRDPPQSPRGQMRDRVR
jgi:error-prone DNA polymerase